MEINVDNLVVEFNRLLEKQIAAPNQLVDYVTKLITEYINLADKDLDLAQLIAQRQLALITALVRTDTTRDNLSGADLSLQRKTVEDFLSDYPNAEFLKINLTDGVTPFITDPTGNSNAEPYYKPRILYGRSSGTGGDGRTGPIF